MGLWPVEPQGFLIWSLPRNLTACRPEIDQMQPIYSTLSFYL
ncbi:hypothetical protein CAter282_1157 [Collimonas arenae]|uniref:Uncharacterized protein n=1 Tax=Collimonas arenae TaxID=279058 RepID=A0A127QFV9_9BURK|nr:hypothetical protein CAter282_1157 [Collimonas arenae]